jgi:hypothetical protein
MQICVHPIDDILKADESHMRERIREIVCLCREVGVRSYYISTGSLAPYGAIEEVVAHFKTWVRVAREECKAFVL